MSESTLSAPGQGGRQDGLVARAVLAPAHPHLLIPGGTAHPEIAFCLRLSFSRLLLFSHVTDENTA